MYQYLSDTAVSHLPLVVENLPANAGDISDVSSMPASERSPEEDMATTTVFLPGESHEPWRVASYSPHGHK